MFGHDNQQHQESTLPAPSPDGALTGDDASATTPQVSDTAGDYIDDTPIVAGPTITQPDPATAPAVSGVTAAAEPTVAPVATPADGTPDTDRLLDIKQQALQQLTPLVGHLEQAPEDEFRTTMMMIQASDNHELISKAYEAAQKISDDKARAQALLDIVNEINYFTHNGANAA